VSQRYGGYRRKSGLSNPTVGVYGVMELGKLHPRRTPWRAGATSRTSEADSAVFSVQRLDPSRFRPRQCELLREVRHYYKDKVISGRDLDVL
jgi:hypothetical protein